MPTSDPTRPRTIIRAEHNAERRYMLLARATAQDPDLSLEGLGLLTSLLSRPDTWRPNVRELAKARRCTKDRIARILRELVAKGYCRRTSVRRGTPGSHGAAGQFARIDYLLFEEKRASEAQSHPCPETPDTGFRDIEITEGESTKRSEWHAPRAPARKVEEEALLAPLRAAWKRVRRGRLAASAEDLPALRELAAELGVEDLVVRYEAWLRERTRKGHAPRLAYFLENIDTTRAVLGGLPPPPAVPASVVQLLLEINDAEDPAAKANLMDIRVGSTQRNTGKR